MSSPRKVKAIITEIRIYRDDITFFRFKLEFKCKYKPGQFLHLALDNYDPSYNWPESRVFSIANSPDKEFIDILVSPKGKFTKKMIHELKIGSQVWLKLPYGIFNFDASINKDVILIAGGTGISPFISFLDYTLDKQVIYRSISLFYGVRHSDLIIFDEIINICKQKIKQFHFQLYCENITSRNSLLIKHGILPVKEIAKKTSALPYPVYYLSGPRTMIETFDTELKNLEINSGNIFYDKWE
jgi:ferredoxin-NADP reductase